jgi:hypothetical protein
MTSLWERKSSAKVPMALRKWAADSDLGEVIASDATMALRFAPALARASPG